MGTFCYQNENQNSKINILLRSYLQFSSAYFTAPCSIRYYICMQCVNHTVVWILRTVSLPLYPSWEHQLSICKLCILHKVNCHFIYTHCNKPVSVTPYPVTSLTRIYGPMSLSPTNEDSWLNGGNLLKVKNPSFWVIHTCRKK